MMILVGLLSPLQLARADILVPDLSWIVRMKIGGPVYLEILRLN